MIVEAFRKIAQDSPSQAPSVEEAREAMRRLHRIEENRPTATQALRYAGIGTVVMPALAGVAGAIAGKPAYTGSAIEKARQGAAHSLRGAVISGAIPILRNTTDQEAEKQKLQAFLSGNKERYVTPHGRFRRFMPGQKREEAAFFKEIAEKYPAALAKTSAGCMISFGLDGQRAGVEWHDDAIARIMGLPRQSGSLKLGALTEMRDKIAELAAVSPTKIAFRRSFYHGTGAWGPMFMRGPNMPDPGRVAQSQRPAQAVFEQLRRQQKLSSATTPAGRLAEAKRVGLPSSSFDKGPSLAQISARPSGPGAGETLPGAKKGGMS